MTAWLSRAGWARCLVLAATAALAFSATASAGGRVVSSVMLLVEGDIPTESGPILTLGGRVHVVSQVWQTEGGFLMGLHLNLADFDATGDDGSTWVGVGAVQVPPNPVEPDPDDPNAYPPNPIVPPASFTLMPVAGAQPDAPASVPFTLYFDLTFDEEGRLIGDMSSAIPEAGVAGH